MPFTSFLLLQIGAAAFTSVYTVAQAILGSILIAGNLYLDTTSNNYPALCVNSGCVLSFSGEDDVAGGGKRVTVSGSYLRAEVQLPTNYASGGYLRQFSIECGGTPIALSGSVSIRTATKQAHTAGTALRSALKVGSGGGIIANTGATINTKIGAGRFVSFIGTGGTTITAAQIQNEDCVFRPEFRSKYGR